MHGSTRSTLCEYPNNILLFIKHSGARVSLKGSEESLKINKINDLVIGRVSDLKVVMPPHLASSVEDMAVRDVLDWNSARVAEHSNVLANLKEGRRVDLAD